MRNSIDAGIIKNRQVELINGEIINISPEEPVHRFGTSFSKNFFQKNNRI